MNYFRLPKEHEDELQELPVIKFHWFKQLILLARDQLGAFSLSLRVFFSPKTFVRAKFFRMTIRAKLFREK
jgi:hypothetical protein